MASSVSGSLRGGRGRKFKAEINVVPYIDVMLVLLVIFMVTAPLTNPGIINLPTVGKSNQAPSNRIQIMAASKDEVHLQLVGGKTKAEKQAVGRKDLNDKLRKLYAEDPALPVMIIADKEMKYDDVIQIYKAAHEIGFKRIGLATK